MKGDPFLFLLLKTEVFHVSLKLCPRQRYHASGKEAYQFILFCLLPPPFFEFQSTALPLLCLNEPKSIEIRTNTGEMCLFRPVWRKKSTKREVLCLHDRGWSLMIWCSCTPNGQGQAKAQAQAHVYSERYLSPVTMICCWSAEKPQAMTSIARATTAISQRIKITSPGCHEGDLKWKIIMMLP